MQSKLIKISLLKNNTGQIEGVPKNPRLIKDAKFEKLKQSIQDDPEMLSLRELLVYPYDEKYVVLGGNMRLRACKELGYTEMECKVIPEDTSAKKLRAIVQKDNLPYGENDWDLLANEWDAEELDEWGLDTPDNWEEETEVEEDEAPEVDESGPPKSKLGEIYQLGRHRVFCGDSTLRTSYEMLMGGKNADLVFTDPPYGMKKENEGVLNDNLNYDRLLEFNKAWIPLTFDFMKEVGSWYCWGIDEPLMDIYSEILKPMARNQKLTFRNLITWDKGNAQGQLAEARRMYSPADEKCLFVMGGVQGFNDNADNYYEGWEPIRSYLETEMNKVGGSKKWKEALGNQMGAHYFTKSQWLMPTRENYEKLQSYANGSAFKQEYDTLKQEYDTLKQEYDTLKQEYDEIKREYYATRAYFDNTHDNMNNVWHFDRTGQEEREGTGEHATPKPLALCARAINSSSREGEIVLDVFLGSGSTLIACEQTDRTCYGMELDPKYVDVIRKRYHKFVTGSEEEWEDGTRAV